MSRAIIFVFFSLLTSSLYADEKSPTKPSSKSEPSFMCKRMRDAKLADLKESLMDECNLNKPFSIGTDSGTSIQDVYTFCCHKSE